MQGSSRVPLVIGVLFVCTQAVVGQAQQRDTRVSRAQSMLLLDMPDLERGREEFHYFGWTQEFAVELSLAVVTLPGDANPHAVVVMQQLSKGWRWRASRLDEAQIRKLDPVLRNKRIEITQAAREGSSAYLKYVLFTADDAPCAAFDFRRISPGAEDGGGEAGFSGVYCAKPRTAFGDSEIARLVAGVYVNVKGEIRRAYEIDQTPIPDRVRR